MWTHIRILLICACAVTAQIIEKDGIETKGPLSDIINNIIERIKPYLKLIKIEHFEFHTGEQEFGNFDGIVDNVEVTGVSDLVATIIDVSVIPLRLKNLTIEIENVNLKGDYNLDGALFFPLNNDRIHVFGEGPMDITLKKVKVSVSANVKYSQCIISLANLKVFLDIGDLQVELKDIMGGGDLEKAFNQLFTDIGIVVIDYYKESLIEGIIPKVTEKINEFLAQHPNTNDCN